MFNRSQVGGRLRLPMVDICYACRHWGGSLWRYVSGYEKETVAGILCCTIHPATMVSKVIFSQFLASCGGALLLL